MKFILFAHLKITAVKMVQRARERMIADFIALMSNDEKCVRLNWKKSAPKKNDELQTKQQKVVNFTVIWLARNSLIAGKVSFI